MGSGPDESAEVRDVGEGGKLKYKGDRSAAKERGSQDLSVGAIVKRQLDCRTLCRNPEN